MKSGNLPAVFALLAALAVTILASRGWIDIGLFWQVAAYFGVGTAGYMARGAVDSRSPPTSSQQPSDSSDASFRSVIGGDDGHSRSRP